jgi:putative addiction module component (TIGR02574 family)
MNEVEKLALDLPESERAVLAAHLLGSLPPVLHDEDEGIAEALRRDLELDAHPEHGLSVEQLDRKIESRRR